MLHQQQLGKDSNRGSGDSEALVRWCEFIALLCGAAVAGLLALANLSPTFAQADATTADIAAYRGADRTQRLIEGAKKEATITVYTSATVEDMAVLTAAFEKKHGVKVRVWRASSENILQRAVVEASVSRFEVDVFETDDGAMESLHREKLLQPVKSPAFTDIVPAAIPSHGEWIGTRYNIFAAARNTMLVRKEELPKSYDDLLQPRWNGKLGIESDDSDWFGGVVRELGEQRGLKLFQGIVASNGISVRKGHSLLANLVVSGEVPLALTTYAYRVEQLKRSGAPIDWFIIPPGIARFQGVGVASRAAHPYAAILFFEFMLTDAQELMLKRDMFPISQKVKPLTSTASLKFLDPARVLDESEKWSKYYRDIVGRVR